jgi:crotonobetainyl-CoA:carnitine CoA-transferase CaiB-like acyl-CoA transferase
MRPASAHGAVAGQLRPKLGTISVTHLPFHNSDTDTTIRSVPRSIGQHNPAVATGCRYAPADREALLQDGAVSTP